MKYDCKEYKTNTGDKRHAVYEDERRLQPSETAIILNLMADEIQFLRGVILTAASNRAPVAIDDLLTPLNGPLEEAELNANGPQQVPA